MTATELLFLYFCACALSWGAHWMKVWERRALDRKLAEQQATILIWEALRLKLGEIIGETVFDLLNAQKRAGPENWIPSKFFTNEYKINEAVNLALIDKLWPRIRNEVIDPLDRLEKDLERDNQPIVDEVLNRFKMDPNPNSNPTDRIHLDN